MAEKENKKYEMGDLVVPENKEVFKKWKERTVALAESQLKRAPSGQSWNNWGNQMKNAVLGCNAKCKRNIRDSIQI